jgi:hypothetical protein
MQMKKTYYVLLLVLLASVSAKAQTGWVTQNVDEKISIKFPVETKKTTAANGSNVYTVKGQDSIGYSATMTDLNVTVHIDSAALAPLKDTQEFADQMMAGMASKKANYAFGAVTLGKWKNNTTYSITGTETTKKSTLFVQMMLIGSKMYIFSCSIPPNLTTKNNEIFFSTIELLK